LAILINAATFELLFLKQDGRAEQLYHVPVLRDLRFPAGFGDAHQKRHNVLQGVTLINDRYMLPNNFRRVQQSASQRAGAVEHEQYHFPMPRLQPDECFSPSWRPFVDGLVQVPLHGHRESLEGDVTHKVTIDHPEHSRIGHTTCIGRDAGGVDALADMVASSATYTLIHSLTIACGLPATAVSTLRSTNTHGGKEQSTR
jgi:hypothetical protein